MTPGLRCLPGSTALRVAWLVAAALLVGVLTGCGAGAGSEPQASERASRGDPAGHNQIDIDFAQMMLVHTRQSADLVALAAERSDHADVLALAEAVAADDEATIEKMTQLLESWDEEVPDQIALTEMDHSQMDHEGIGMGFMAGISDDQVTLLSALDGESFDSKFLRFMLIHRGAAVAMAQNERIYGQAATAIRVARAVEADQADQMDTIQAMREAG